MPKNYDRKVKIKVDPDCKSVTFSIKISDEIVISTKMSSVQMEVMIAEYYSLLHDARINRGEDGDVTEGNNEEIN